MRCGIGGLAMIPTTMQSASANYGEHHGLGGSGGGKGGKPCHILE